MYGIGLQSRKMVLVCFEQSENHTIQAISCITFSHLTFLELHFGHFRRSTTFLSFIKIAGAQPEQKVIDLPRLLIALPAFSSASVFPKYQTWPHDPHVHLVSWSLLIGCLLSISYLNEIFRIYTKLRPSRQPFDHPCPFRDMTHRWVAEHGAQYQRWVLYAMPWRSRFRRLVGEGTSGYKAVWQRPELSLF